LTTCYQLPTITQAILEVAGLTNSPPEMVAAQNSIAPGYNVIAGNPTTAPFAPDFLPISFPLPAKSTTSTTVSGLLSTLTPIAFASQTSGTAVPTQLYDPNADTVFSAVGVSSQGLPAGPGNLTNPDTVYFFYEDLFRNNQKFSNGQIVAKFSFPLTVLNTDGSENPPVTITLQVIAKANCNSDSTCLNALQAYIVSGFGASTSNMIAASQFGISFALVFSGSPSLAQNHAIFELAVPLLVTGRFPTTTNAPFSAPLHTDPPYFYSAITGNPGNVSAAAYLAGKGPLTGNFSVYTAFGEGPEDVLGAILPSGILPAPAYSIGLAPTATPFCTSTTCPLPPGTPPLSPLTFSLCATLPDNSNGPGATVAKLRSAVGAYYAIATDGETYLGAPLAPTIPSVCPVL
jgi:hypothetical protein